MRRALILTALAALAAAASADAAPTQIGSGESPAVAVDGAGTGHVVWNESKPGGVDVLHYCRVPASQSACADEQTFTPYAPQSSYDDAGPQVLLGAPGEVVLLTHRVGPTVHGQWPDFAYVSTAGGDPGTFGGPTPLGGDGPSGRPAVFDAGERLVVTVSASRTGGTFVHGAPIDGSDFAGADAQLSSGDKAYEGTIARRGPGSYLAAYADFDNVYLRPFDCSGAGCVREKINSAAAWGAELTLPGAQGPRLAAGPSGAFLLYRDSGHAQLAVRAVTPTALGPPQLLGSPGAGASGRDLVEDPTGTLHAVFVDGNGALQYRASADGSTWSPAATLQSGQAIAGVRVAAGGGHGFAVWSAGVGNQPVLIAPLPSPSPSPPGSESPSPLAAAFAAPAVAKRLGVTLLDASSAVGARKLLWDLNGDGRDDVACGSDQPYLATRLLGGGAGGARLAAATSVRLTAVAADGRTSTARQSVAFSGPRLSGKMRAVVPATSRCGAVPGAVTDANHVRPGQASTVLCLGAAGQREFFGAIEARGCFSRATAAQDVPGGERAVLDELAAAYERSSTIRSYVGTYCLYTVASKNCHSGALGRLLRSSELLVSKGPVRIDGLLFVPERGAAIVLSPLLGRVVSSNATVVLSKIHLHSGRLNLFVGQSRAQLLGRSVSAAATARSSTATARAASGVTSVLDRSARIDHVFGTVSFKPAVLGSFGGFAPTGGLELALVKDGDRYFTEASLNFRLPSFFHLPGLPAPRGPVIARADNDSDGLELDELHLGPVSLPFGWIQFENLQFDYSRSGHAGLDPQYACARDWWAAQGKIRFGASGTALALAPFPPKGVAFCAGSLRAAGGAFDFGALAPQIFPGVFLDTVGFGLGFSPTRASGSASVSALELLAIKDATLLSVFASPGAPYRFHEDGPLARLNGTQVDSTTFAVGGQVGVRLPAVGTWPLYGGYLMYSAGGAARFGGEMRLGLPVFRLTGGVDGAIAPAGRTFSLHGSVEVEVASLDLVGAEGWVTSKGVAVCGHYLGWDPGFGYSWGDGSPTIYWGYPGDGCKPSGWWVEVGKAGASSSAALSRPLSFKVAEGEGVKNVRLTGTTGAPLVQVSGPGGETLSTAGSGLAAGRSLAVLRDDETKTTWLGLGKPGRYTITRLADSPPIDAVAATRPFAGGPAKVSASVARKGPRRILRYRAHFSRRERVTLFESGPGGVLRKLGAAHKGRGTIVFRPAPGSAGKRRILAQVEVQGVVTPTSVVATYRAPRRPRAGRPRGVRVHRHGGRLLVTWRRSVGASAYGVTLQLRDGSQRRRRVSGHRPRARFANVRRDLSGSVVVQALGPRGDWGKPARSRFRAQRRQITRLLPFSELRHRKHRR